MNHPCPAQVFGTRLGPRGSWGFLLNFAFEFAITYFLVAPLSLLWIKIFLPSLLFEHLRRVEDDGDRPRYPYATPCPQTPLEFLLDLDPSLAPLVEAQVKTPAPLKPRRSLARGPAAAAGPPLEVLEEIYAEDSWRPSRLNYLALGVLAYFLELPEALQDVFVEELLLLVPAGATFVCRDIFASGGTVRKGTYSNGGFMLVFALIFGNLAAFGLTALLARVQQRGEDAHARRLAGLRDAAAKFGTETDDGRSSACLALPHDAP